MKKTIIFLLLTSSLTSCFTERKFNRYANEHPDKLLEITRDRFPCETTKTDTFYIVEESQPVILNPVFLDSIRTVTIDSILKIYQSEDSLILNKVLDQGIEIGVKECEKFYKLHPIVKTVTIEKTVLDTKLMTTYKMDIANLQKDSIRQVTKIEDLNIKVSQLKQKIKKHIVELWMWRAALAVVIFILFRKYFGGFFSNIFKIILKFFQ